MSAPNKRILGVVLLVYILSAIPSLVLAFWSPTPVGIALLYLASGISALAGAVGLLRGRPFLPWLAPPLALWAVLFVIDGRGLAPPTLVQFFLKVGGGSGYSEGNVLVGVEVLALGLLLVTVYASRDPVPVSAAAPGESPARPAGTVELGISENLTQFRWALGGMGLGAAVGAVLGGVPGSVGGGLAGGLGGVFVAGFLLMLRRRG